MLHVLILHASLGTGHTSAANAVAQALARFQDVEVNVIDILDHTSELTRKALTTFYLQVSEKAPLLYKMLYEGTESDKPDDPFASEKLLALVGPPLFSSLQKLIKENNHELVISTHPIGVQMVNKLVEQEKFYGLHFAVITDFVAHRTWMAHAVDGYFVPSKLTLEILSGRGVPPEKMHVTGIPVNLEIAEPKEPKAMRAKHGLSQDVPLITLFGGGILSERVRRMVVHLLESSLPFELVVVAGRNKDLEEELQDLGDGPAVRLRNLGRIDYVDDLVAASDVVITKAGGLIVSEILARSTPMIIIDPIPGQEEWNADFCAGAGAAIQLLMPEMVPAAVEFLLQQPARINAMGIQARLVGHPNAAIDVAEYALKAWQKRTGDDPVPSTIVAPI